MPDDINEKNRALNIQRDYDALIVELELNGVKVSKQVSEILKMRLGDAKDILENCV